VSKLFYSYYESPLGELEICVSDTGLRSLSFIKTKSNEIPKKPTDDHALIVDIKKQMENYFSKRITVFDLALDPGGTEFQTKVWNELIKIPFGKTLTYLEMAKKLGDVKSIRAAASANGKNPIAIIIPCHRVIGSNGTLVGYAGDLWRKEWLLNHESNQETLF
jgi:methylated-DNA-[protein]-cysteine S-methyltransferase